MQSGTHFSKGRPLFTILCVCTGNICRSPVAERLLSTALGPGVTVLSAGTQPVLDAPIEPPMAELLSARGVPPEGFAARRLQIPMLRAADLVLTMTLSQRALVVELAPAVVRRAFTLKEFARLLASADPLDLPAGGADARLHAAVAAAAAQRGYHARSEDDEVADPYRRGDAAYQQAFAGIVDAVDTIAGALQRARV